MWEHARRCEVGNPAGSGGGRLGCFYPLISTDSMVQLFIVQFLLPPYPPDVIYTNFQRGRALDVIYTNLRGIGIEKRERKICDILTQIYFGGKSVFLSRSRLIALQITFLLTKLIKPNSMSIFENRYVIIDGHHYFS